MITIPVLVVQVSDGMGGTFSANTPATPIPTDAIAVICDGTTYTVYEPGDTVPVQS